MELNPEHPTTKGAHDHWHKIAALMMMKLGVKEFFISPAEIEKFLSPDMGIAVKFDDKTGIELYLVNQKEAMAAAIQEGGLRDGQNRTGIMDAKIFKQNRNR